MKTFVSLVLLLVIPFTIAGQQAGAPQNPPEAPQQRQAGPGKKIVLSPFGPQEVDMSDPRPAISVGPPLEAPPAATPIPAQPAPAQAAPAVPAQQPPAAAQQPQAAPSTQPAQNDPVVPISLRFDNQDIYAVIRIIADALGLNYLI